MSYAQGPTIGQRMKFTLDRSIRKAETIDMAIIEKLHLDRMKFDVILKGTKNTKIARVTACPLKTLSFGGGAMMVVPKVGDLVMIEYNRKDLEKLIKTGSLRCTMAGEYEIIYGQNGIVTGVIFPIPEFDGGELSTINISKELGINEKRLNKEKDTTQDEYFMRPRINPSYSAENAKIFIRERLVPNEGDIIIFHGNDHEIRLNDNEIHLKHRTGSQIIFRENGDLVIYAWGGLNIHARENINIDSEMNVNINNGVAPRKRPYRVWTETPIDM